MAVAKAWEGGEILFAGGTDWAMDDRENYPNLYLPHRLKSLSGVRIAFIAAGASAVHCLAGDMEGRLYTWGRNEKGQLGHGDLLQRNAPTVVAGLEGKFISAAAAGKQHTVAVTREGSSWSFGCNTAGQCGVGVIKNKQGKTGPKVDDLLLSPTAVVSVSGASSVSAGTDFTLWLADGKVWSCGNPQYGQLGDGSDHAYNAKESSISIVYEPQPTPRVVSGFGGKPIARMVAGQQHSVAVDNEGSCYTWGNGGYGRLGHKVQQDEHKPRKVDFFSGRMLVPKNAIIGAGSTSSFCMGPGDQVYAWGKLKTSGDNQMYPSPVSDLMGWHVRSLSCGPQTFAVAADSSTITWGGASNGELGYGADGRKSSAKPDKCFALEEVHVESVAAGNGFTLFLADPEHAKVKAAPEFAPALAAEVAVPVDEEGETSGKGKGKGGKAAAAQGTKRKAPEPKAKAPAKPKAKGKKKANASDTEDDD